MEYFAGFFDAEGCICLNKNGSFPIGIEVANEIIPNLFQEKFQGSIYTRKRKDRKKTWTWRINSISEQALFFIESIFPYSKIKYEQLKCLQYYLKISRFERRQARDEISKKIRDLKEPKNVIIPFALPDDSFWRWLAGMIDGNGNFCINEYIDNRNRKKYFSHQLSLSSIHKNVIQYIKHHIPGTITECKRTKNPVFKWTCHRYSEQFVSENIHPFLKIKKGQCECFRWFLHNLPDWRMYELINEMKHLNSL